MVAIVSGGSRGIGREIVKTFVAKGVKVAFCYKTSEDEALQLCSTLNNDGNLNCIAIKCDVRNAEEIENFVKTTIAVFGKIDVVVNNAAIAYNGLLIDMEQKDWRNVMETNLDSVFYMSKECIPHMLDGGGCIINISSVWGIYGASMEVAYSAAKAGVIGLTKALAQEVGRAGIRVNCIAPGVIDTDMNSIHSNEVMDDLIDRTALCRIGVPKDVADAVVFLASEEGKFITGQVIEVGGGFR